MVYLIHFDKPYKHAKHYIGFCEGTGNLEPRMQAHAKGQGARLLEVLKQAGVGWKLVRVWRGGDRNFERALKKQKNTPRMCPICNSSLGDIEIPEVEFESQKCFSDKGEQELITV